MAVNPCSFKVGLNYLANLLGDPKYNLSPESIRTQSASRVHSGTDVANTRSKLYLLVEWNTFQDPWSFRLGTGKAATGVSQCVVPFTGRVRESMPVFWIDTLAQLLTIDTNLFIMDHGHTG